MTRKPVDWHWPREDLATSYVNMFSVVNAHSLVLFAPRGKGKTEFMTKDVAPVAEAQGFFPVYVNFWDDHTAPGNSLRYAMLRAADEAGKFAKLRDLMSRTGVEVTMGLNLGVASVSLKSKTQGAPTEETVHLEMRQILDGLCKCVGKPILFIFDEVQTLATKSEHEAFVRSFRTMLDERRGKIFSIFTGSSQTKLTELFSRIKAPLYNFSSQIPFPALGDPFLKHWMGNIQQIMGKAPELTLDRMRRGFEATDQNPRVFWGAVMTMIQENSLDIERYARSAAASTADNAGVKQRLLELTPLDKLVLTEVLESTRRVRDGGAEIGLLLFAKDTRDKMGAVIGMVPSPSQVQKSLRRLMSEEMQLVVSKDRGHYEIEDSFFEDLIEEFIGDRVATVPLRLAGPTTECNDADDIPDTDALPPPSRPKPRRP